MEHHLTPDQRSFQAATRDFLDKTVPTDVVRSLAESGEGFDPAWWRRGAELGWTAMLVPEELGGGTVSGCGLADLALVAAEVGAHCAPGPLVSTSAVLTGLVRSAAAHADTVTGIVEGARIVSWAVYETSRGWPESLSGTTAAPRPGGGYVVTGAKDRVEAGEQADAFLVSALSPDGPVQLLVPRDATGIEVTPVWTLDTTRRLSRLDLQSVEVGPEAVVHAGADAAAAVEAQMLVAATLACAGMTAAVQHTFDMTVQWMFDRYTFGRPLASYQALKHRMADNKTWLEACHATTGAAAQALGSGAEGAGELVSIAKSFVGDKAPTMVQDFIQLHGGLGVTWEHDLHLYLRRVTSDRALYGTPEDHRRRITSHLERKSA